MQEQAFRNDGKEKTMEEKAKSDLNKSNINEP